MSERILITRTDRIGDLVLSTPVFKALREAYPDAHIAVLTFCENREVVEGNPYLNDVILYDKKGSERSWLGTVRFAFSLRKKKFDQVIHLHGTNRMHWVGFLAGIPKRAGWARRSPWLLTQSFTYVKNEGSKHEAEYNLDLLEHLGIQRPEKIETFFPVTERSVRSLEEWLSQKGIDEDRPWILINPSASDASKMWPTASFARLLDIIDEKYRARFLVIGAKHDRQTAANLCALTQAKAEDLSGHLTLGMLGALCRKAALLISNDSGPVHIAQAVGTPVISVFVRKDPGVNAGRWKPLYENGRVFVMEEATAEALAGVIPEMVPSIQLKQAHHG